MKTVMEAAARLEFEDAVDRYLAENTALAERFIDDVVAARELIEAHPRSGNTLFGSVRRIILSNFPYQLVYLADPDSIRIIAVAHLKRHPRYWRSRV